MSGPHADMLGSLWSASTDVSAADPRVDRHLEPASPSIDRAKTGWSSRPALLLGIFFVSLYLLTMGGHLDSPDEELMFQVTRSLAERGSLSISGTGVAERLTLTGGDGRTYVPYSPVASVVSVPFYELGRLIAANLPSRYTEVATRFAVGMRDAVITGLACVVFYGLAIELAYGVTAAILLTLCFGLGTLVWPFSKYSFSEPVTGFFLLLAVYAAVRAVRPGQLGWSAASGLALGLGVGSKATAAFAAPALVLYLVGAGEGTLQARLRRLVPFLVVVTVPAVALAVVNTARFGNPLDTGYNITGLVDFSHPVGIAGLLLSPSKSLFLYAPIGLLGLVGLVVLAARLPWEAGVFLWLVASHVVFHGALAIWPGDAGWGPRYLVPVVPFIVAPAGAALAWTTGLARRFAYTSFAVLFGLGVLVNLGGVLVDQRVSFVRLLDEAGGNFTVMDEHRWNPDLSPVLIHWQEIGTRLFGLVRTLSQPVSLVSGTYGKETSELGDTSASELFPRWTSGSAVFDLSTHGQPATLSLGYFDNRPDSLRPADVQIVVDGSILPPAAITRTQSAVAIPQHGAPLLLDARLDSAVEGHDSVTLEIRSTTWQPARDAGIPDVRDLGIEIWDLRITSNGRDLTIGEALYAPMPVSDARPWSTELETWFYTPRWHAADVWLWFLYLSGLPRALMLIAAVPLVALVWSAIALRRSL